MTKNGPIPKTKTDSESGECTDHLSTLQKNANLQSPVKNHPNVTTPSQQNTSMSQNRRGATPPPKTYAAFRKNNIRNFATQCHHDTTPCQPLSTELCVEPKGVELSAVVSSGVVSSDVLSTGVVSSGVVSSGVVSSGLVWQDRDNDSSDSDGSNIDSSDIDSTDIDITDIDGTDIDSSDISSDRDSSD